MNLESVRSEFPVLEQCAYLNAGTFGPLPRVTIAAQRSQMEQELALAGLHVPAAQAEQGSDGGKDNCVTELLVPGAHEKSHKTP